MITMSGLSVVTHSPVAQSRMVPNFMRVLSAFMRMPTLHGWPGASVMSGTYLRCGWDGMGWDGMRQGGAQSASVGCNAVPPRHGSEAALCRRLSPTHNQPQQQRSRVGHPNVIKPDARLKPHQARQQVRPDVALSLVVDAQHARPQRAQRGTCAAGSSVGGVSGASGTGCRRMRPAASAKPRSAHTCPAPRTWVAEHARALALVQRDAHVVRLAAAHQLRVAVVGGLQRPVDGGRVVKGGRVALRACRGGGAGGARGLRGALAADGTS